MNFSVSKNESEDRSKIERKKMIDASTNIIMTRLEELRGASNQEKAKMRRRWIWELIQNAVDSSRESGVKIWVKYDKERNFLRFSHDGKFFTYNNLIDLITQISSKSDDVNNVGKFGTGFISTHLISGVVNVEGYYQRNIDNDESKKINFILDRSGETREAIKNSTEQAISNLDNLLSIDANTKTVDENCASTSFIYDLKYSSPDVHKSIQEGINDLDMNIPYVFLFSNKLKEVYCDENVYRKKNVNKPRDWQNISVLICEKENLNDKSKEETLVMSCFDPNFSTTIAFKFHHNGDSKFVEPMEDTPKIFCSFPLIGTESFSFPFAVNSPYFKVLQERNGIQEGSEVNRHIFDVAVKLYSSIMDYMALNEGWKQLYNLCKVAHNGTELQNKLKNNIVNVYSYKKIIPFSEKEKSSLFSWQNSQNCCETLIPYMDKKELNDPFWELINEILLNKPIPIKMENVNWAEISSPNRIGIDAIRNFLCQVKMVTGLSIKNNYNCYDWLNRLYDIWFKSVNNDVNSFISKVLVPNQNEEFVGANNIYMDDDIDEELKNILKQLGEDIRYTLLSKQVVIPTSNSCRKMNSSDVANKIYMKVKDLQHKETSGEKRKLETQVIYNQLTDWFLGNTDNAKEWFKDIYDNKHLLSSREETIRRLELASTVERAMGDNNICIDQLGILINEAGKLLKLHENGDIILNEDAKELLNHISTNSQYAAEHVNYLIERSIENVHKKLKNIKEYTIESTVEEWKAKRYSKTVFPAVKGEKDIVIVIRPSDDNKIIFYEDAETEALDSTEFELWIDDGVLNPRKITLGEIIKTTGISKIPLYRIV